MSMIRALSLPQPWAWLLARGLVTHLPKPFSCRHRGPFLLHASRNQAADREHLLGLLLAQGIDPGDAQPTGALVGIARLVECLPVELARPMPIWEATLPGWEAGGCVWRLEEPSVIPSRPWRGQRGFFWVAEEPGLVG